MSFVHKSFVFGLRAFPLALLCADRRPLVSLPFVDDYSCGEDVVNSAPSIVSVPVRLPGSGIGEDLVAYLNVYDVHGRESPADIGGRSCRPIDPAAALKNLGRSSKCVLAHQFAVNQGDSVHFQFYDICRLPFLVGRVRKVRDVTVYLLDCDPAHAGVAQAASRACLADGSGPVFVVVDETPQKADRVLSFQFDILVKDLFTRKDIAALISQGFYLHNGSLRCTGCHYHKNREQLIRLINGESGKWSVRIRHKFPSVFSISDVIMADHEHPKCDNYWPSLEKTFFTIDDVELGHYALYSYNGPDKQYVEYRPPTDQSGAPVTSSAHQPGKNSEYFSCPDQYRGLPPISYFVTTISRANFFDQGDLLSFCVRDMFASLREAFQPLKSCLMPSARTDDDPPVPSPLDRLMGEELEECLCHLYSKTFRSVYLLERLHHSQATYQPADIQAAVASCQAPVVPLLDRLLVLINQCGGDVTERGLVCLIIDAEGPTYFQYDDHGAVMAEVHGPVSGHQLSRQRYQRMAAGIDFFAALSQEVLQPLLNIFHPSQLSSEALRKIFCASEFFIERLLASETECGDF